MTERLDVSAKFGSTSVCHCLNVYVTSARTRLFTTTYTEEEKLTSIFCRFEKLAIVYPSHDRLLLDMLFPFPIQYFAAGFIQSDKTSCMCFGLLRAHIHALSFVCDCRFWVLAADGGATGGIKWCVWGRRERGADGCWKRKSWDGIEETIMIVCRSTLIFCRDVSEKLLISYKRQMCVGVFFFMGRSFLFVFSVCLGFIM